MTEQLENLLTNLMIIQAQTYDAVMSVAAMIAGETGSLEQIEILQQLHAEGRIMHPLFKEDSDGNL